MKSTTAPLAQSLQFTLPQRQRSWRLLLRNLNFFCKRSIDLVITGIALLLLWPLGLFIALLIKLDSPGPAFFTQERVGAKRHIQDGKEIWEIRHFQIVKFRSMIRNASSAIHEAQVKAFVEGQVGQTDQGENTVKVVNDPRITRIGHWLRKTSLDELPQLLNVLRGDMSLVGPRPVPTYEVALYQDAHYARLMALPGITGLWQVVGRGQVTFEEMMRLDLRYVQQQSIWLDLRILVMTIPAVLRGDGAC
ncbi:MAG: sugar transferase [Caldilinea sp. CFX5]|nr:sugar transferase [Caldilinea sp. CFX5]